MDNRIITRLKALLHEVQLLMPRLDESSSSSELQHVFKNICRLVFDDEAYRLLWDEHTLSQLGRLFQVKPPKLSIFGDQVAEIRERRKQSQRVNDLFFKVLNPEFSVEKVFDALTALTPAESPLLDVLKSSGRLEAIREIDSPPSNKISTFLDFLLEDISLDIPTQESVKGCLEAVKVQEGVGCSEDFVGEIRWPLGPTTISANPNSARERSNPPISP